MKCFFDGSSATGTDGHTWLTLAGYIASDSFWNDFERGWKSEVLEKRLPHAPYLHMKDLVPGNKPYDGWDQERRNRLVIDANLYLQALPKKAFCALVCSIDVSARDKLVEQGCKIESGPQICGHWCIAQAFNWYYDTWLDRLEIAQVYFDQGEEFMHPFRQRWLRESKTQKVVISNTFWGGISEVEALDSKVTPALQASDFLAWAESRKLSSSTDRAQRHLARIQAWIIPSWRLLLNEDVLREKHWGPSSMLKPE
jgi:hypothetical protein